MFKISAIRRAESRILTVPLDAIDMRADRFLLKHISAPSPLLYKLMRKKTVAEVHPDGTIQRLTGSDRVFPGMRIRIPKLPVLFENKAMAVFLKPSGIACQGGSKIGKGDSIDAMLGAVDSSEESGYKLVHRLDLPTSGALAVARGRLAAMYVAVLQGIPAMSKGVIDHPLVERNVDVVPASDENRDRAKEAITKFRVLKTGKHDGTTVSIVEFDILTGRKHQIRVHCSGVLGCPVLGDSKYTPKGMVKSAQMHLHLFKLAIPNLGSSKPEMVTCSTH
ncbi:pseudouridine synthase [Linderina pennispora]|uniref:21S rRNA pseudouridine(2819) synthase n=1 Tax=Linderina pennispora TaxID=61395 RepID=A0A1Y1VWK0_9FUNG|nr:pseudouridine synthase [Linderina pennispora]ORX65660.1 pseudouridine synthase [Linderina pennispora]